MPSGLVFIHLNEGGRRQLYKQETTLEYRRGNVLCEEVRLCTRGLSIQKRKRQPRPPTAWKMRLLTATDMLQ